jgi:glycerol-3-phosphate cytidylyltransferase-like family protein/pyrimidine deaminase RibD-like protein
MKIITLSKLTKKLKPFTATLVGDVFDLFNIEHVRYLQKCSKVGRPLVVVVQADKTAKIRSGFGKPLMNERQRAEMVAALEFVDFVLILERPSDYEKYLQIIKPKNYIYPKGIMKHRKFTARLITEKFPNINIFFLDNNLHQYNADFLIKRLQTRRDCSKIKNPIVRRLYFIADNSKATIGKISALITLNNRIVAESDNIESKSLHAEQIVLRKAKLKGINLEKAKLYILIPPCKLCAQEILKNQLTQIYYLHTYGNDDGIKFLRTHGVKITKLKSDE